MGCRNRRLSRENLHTLSLPRAEYSQRDNVTERNLGSRYQCAITEPVLGCTHFAQLFMEKRQAGVTPTRDQLELMMLHEQQRRLLLMWVRVNYAPPCFWIDGGNVGYGDGAAMTATMLDYVRREEAC